jgi:predicted porin
MGVEFNDGSDAVDADRLALSGGFKVGSAGMIKLTYQTEDENVSEDKTEAFAVGYDHNLSKRTQVYALYLDSTTEHNVGDDATTKIFSVGLNHDF